MIISATQLLVFVPGLGVSRGGNTNWIHLFGFTVQPSELIKVVLAIFLGIAFPVSMARAGNTWRALAPLGATLIVGGLVIIGGDLGTVFIFILISFGGMLFAGMSVRNMLIPVAGGFAAVAVLAVFSSSRVARIVTFYTNACVTDEGDCWQPVHGAWAMARGGIFGVGFGNSRMKWSWLPAADNDYIFAIIGEELGLIGCVVLLGLFVVLAIALLRVIREATDPFIRITTGGILFWFIGQAFLNVAVVLNLIPVLGLPIPFVSSGGTSLLSSLAATGVVLSFARHNERTGTIR
jgi:cell division protein FtsW